MGIWLELLQERHAEELMGAVRRSQGLHLPWVETPTNVDRMLVYLRQSPESCLRYGIREPGGALAGVANASCIVRGVFQNAFLGFYAFTPFAGRGLMFQGLQQVIGRLFSEHGLHRLEANVQPSNARSTALVKKLGFRLEGHSPRYLKICGEWRDHNRYAMTSEEWQTPDVRPG
jgi:ribosomal-protein-alanine N-acetyltransferase